jgi:hypothetical protein
VISSSSDASPSVAFDSGASISTVDFRAKLAIHASAVVWSGVSGSTLGSGGSTGFAFFSALDFATLAFLGSHSLGADKVSSVAERFTDTRCGGVETSRASGFGTSGPAIAGPNNHTLDTWYIHAAIYEALVQHKIEAKNETTLINTIFEWQHL